jgi:hypothetical protein
MGSKKTLVASHTSAAEPPGKKPLAALAVAVLPLLLFVPAIFRYSRILWMSFDAPLD